jgi:hypothetical protein
MILLDRCNRSRKFLLSFLSYKQYPLRLYHEFDLSKAHRSYLTESLCIWFVFSFFGWPLFIKHMRISSFDDFLFYGFGLVCLSRHKNYTYVVLNSFCLLDTKVRLITELSITFVTTFIS